MGKLGYSSITLTDLTETIPVSLVLESNQNKNIQTKKGTLYNPDFSKEGQELIITPTLFLGQEDLYIENQKDKFIDPQNRENGFIFYQIGEIDEVTQLEKKYYYGSSTEESGIWVDEQGKLHFRKNLEENLTIEAYIEKFQNEEHSYVIDLVQAINPIQFLFLDEKDDSFILLVQSTTGRQHFEDVNDDNIILEASLYKGVDLIDTTNIDKYSFEWKRLTDQVVFAPYNENPYQIEVTRGDIYSEDKFVCTLTDRETSLTYSGSIDIWDLNEKYDCVIIKEQGLITESTETFDIYINVFDSNGVLINNELTSSLNEGEEKENNSYSLLYEWGYFCEKKDSNDTVQIIQKKFEKRNNRTFTIDFNNEDFLILKNQTFSIFCNVYNKTENYERRLASEIEVINFTSEHFISIEPQSIFIPTKSDGSYDGGNKKGYSFIFQLKGKDGNPLPYNTNTDLAPSGAGIIFENNSENFWDFKGVIDLEEHNIWEGIQSSKYCNFSFVYQGFSYSTGVTIVKSVIGESVYNIFIDSSSGTVLSLGDINTTLTVNVYEGKTKIAPEKFYYKWYQDSLESSIDFSTDFIKQEENTPWKIEVFSEAFSDKACFYCKVSLNDSFSDDSLLGIAQYNLIDITESKPISLILETPNLEQNIQTKIGDLYTPNFEEESLQIVPSLFIGQEKQENIEEYLTPGNFYYEINGEDYIYTEDSSFIDAKGILRYNKNLTENITIKAFINNFRIPNHNSTTTIVTSTNSINILFLEEGRDNYYAIIECEGGREHFEDTNADSIKMTAKLYKGLDDIALENSSDFTFAWSRLLDNNFDNPETEDVNENIIGSNKTYTVNRKDITNRDLFTCVITDTITGLEYITKQYIYDFTDDYRCNIIYDKPLLLNEKNNQINLTVSAWHKDQDISTIDKYNLSYQWFVKGENQESEILVGDNSNRYQINLDDEIIPQRQTFMVGCRISHTDSMNNAYIIASDIIDIRYSPDYTIKVTPRNIFIPTRDDGAYQGNEFKEYSFNFQLVDKNGNPLPFNDLEDEAPIFLDVEDETTISFIGPNNNKWDFEGTIILDTESKNSLWGQKVLGSKAYEFKYLYYNQELTEEINIIKNFAGKSSYNIFIDSSSGAILSVGDTSTVLTTYVYYGAQMVASETLFYKWSKEEEILEEKTAILNVSSGDFEEKALYRCYVYSDESLREDSLLGFADYSLIDISETKPVSLILNTDLDRNIQIKTGNFYEPNFSKENPLIITPSIFIGQDKMEINEYLAKNDGQIYYKINGIQVEENQDDFLINENKELLIQKNLTENITITCYINKMENEIATIVTTINPVNILFLEENQNNYYAVIECENGREHFEDTIAEDIIMSAKLYYGLDDIALETEGDENLQRFTFAWSRLLDNKADIPETDNNENIISQNKNYTVARADITNRDLFTCIITDTKTGISYTAKQYIYDFTDNYRCDIIYDKPLLLNEKNNQIILNAIVWKKDEKLEDLEDYKEKLTYEWFIVGDNQETEKFLGEGSQLIVENDNENLPKKQSFVIGCKVTYKDSAENKNIIATNTIGIQYVPEYSIKVTPRNIFIPTKEDNTYKGVIDSIDNKAKYKFNFQLVDTKGNLLSYDNLKDTIFNLIPNESLTDKTEIIFEQLTNDKWDFEGTLILDTTSLWGESNLNLNSKTYEFNYQYAEQIFSEEINVIKNIIGKNNYNVFIESSSGLILSLGDTETTLTAKVFYESKSLSVGDFYCNWYKDGVLLTESSSDASAITSEEIIVSANKIGDKAFFSCNIYLNDGSYIGSAQYSLMDITETKPLSLVLSNSEKNIQIKTGDKYEPNFNKKPLTITPSFFIAQDEQEGESYYKKISYFVNEIEYSYKENADEKSTHVNNSGQLIYVDNLTENTIIKATIKNFSFREDSAEINIDAANPVTILFLEEGKDNYYAVLNSEKDHFEDTNASPITLTAFLYKGNQLLNENGSGDFSYKWEKLSKGELTEEITQSIEIKRGYITNRDYYTCIITDNTTGLTYSASKFIYDFTDNYSCKITYNKMPLLTDEKKEITLEIDVWNQEGDKIEQVNNQVLSYEWIIKTFNGTTFNGPKTKKFVLNLSNYPNLKEDFAVYCNVSYNGKLIARDILNVYYTIPYKIVVTPQTIFIPTSADGKYLGDSNGEYHFTFKIVGADGKTPLLMDLMKDSFDTTPPLENELIDFKFEQQETDKWYYNGFIKFKLAEGGFWSSTDNARTYEFSFTYLNQVFTEEINIVKNYKGEQGIQGFSGYTVDLSNEFHAFPGGEMRADPNEITFTEISAFYGDQALDIVEIQVSGIDDGDKSGIIYGAGSSSYTTENNLTLNAQKSNNKIKITMITGSEGSFTAKEDTLTFQITIKKQEGSGTLTIVKYFTYIINYQGKTYYLQTDVNEISYSEANNTYIPDSSVGINVSSLYRSEAGEANTYNGGKIIYSFDNNNWKHLPETNKITGYANNNYKKIYIRLYGSNANLPEDLKTNFTIANYDKYLYDLETIPIITSLDGYEIGGENLLKFTQDLPIGANKWETSNDLIKIARDNNFSYFDIITNGGTNSSIIYSPSIDFLEDYFNKNFCLSFYVKTSENIDSEMNFTASVVLQSDLVGTAKRSGDIIKLIGNNNTSETNSNFKIVLEEGFVTNEWRKMYVIFNLKPNDFNTGSNIPNEAQCQYMKIQFTYVTPTAGNSFQIKKPKLELGNVPTSWSCSPYDFSHNEMSGVNLYNESSENSIISKETPIEIEIETASNYTISYSSSSFTNSSFAILKIFKEGSASSYNEYILPQQDNYFNLTFYVEANSILTIEPENISNNYSLKFTRLKIEKGNSATPWSYSPDELLNLFIPTIENNTTEKINSSSLITNIIETTDSYKGIYEKKDDGSWGLADNSQIINVPTIKTANGLELKFLTVEDFKEYLENVAIQNITAQQEWTANRYRAIEDKILEISNAIKVVADANPPFIEISTASFDSNTSSSDKYSLKLTPDKLGFYRNNSDELASFSSSKLFIQRAQILNELDFGGNGATSYLQLKVTPDGGVGFLWYGG